MEASTNQTSTER